MEKINKLKIKSRNEQLKFKRLERNEIKIKLRERDGFLMGEIKKNKKNKIELIIGKKFNKIELTIPKQKNIIEVIYGL